MPDVKILDCTLRDGGYLNNWNFGRQSIINTIEILCRAGIDFIETGFMTTKKSQTSQTLYNSFEEINNIIPNGINTEKLFVMIKIGEFPADLIPVSNKTAISGIRVIFKKHQINDALNYCKIIKEKGYKLFINPTFIDNYTKNDFLFLINEINKIKPYAFTIVDSTGSFKKDKIEELFKIINQNLNPNISICFHTHNNLGLSLSNACYFIDLFKKYDLITDSSLSGIGRGAGNLKTEILSNYLNEKYFKNYNVDLIRNFVKKVYNKPAICYFLSAVNLCHPDYAKFILNSGINSVKNIDEIFKLIPETQKDTFDIDLIKRICKEKSR